MLLFVLPLLNYWLNYIKGKFFPEVKRLSLAEIDKKLYKKLNFFLLNIDKYLFQQVENLKNKLAKLRVIDNFLIKHELKKF